jgi:tungstate transport system substrate-binding protein
MRTRLLLLTVFLCAAALGACGGDDPRVLLATTTSTEDSGLLPVLLAPFEAHEGIRVDRIAVGTGQALKLGRAGDADIILVHARDREDRFVADGWGIDRRDIMWNDFVILGPPDDPVGIKGSADAGVALQKIASAKAKFVSRGDDSGTHTKERTLWNSSGGLTKWEGYIETGAGMGTCLTNADELRAYVLTDRSTYLKFLDKVDLDVLVEGGASLENPYGAILVNPERHEGLNVEGARKLLDYLTGPEAQALIRDFRVNGEVLFHPHAGE